jgi:hypothetical protein
MNSKKLTLNKESLRVLQAAETHQAEGAIKWVTLITCNVSCVICTTQTLKPPCTIITPPTGPIGSLAC